MYSNNLILFAAAGAEVPSVWDSVLNAILMILFSLIAIVVVMTFAGLSVVAERKVCAYIQGRYGPNRTAIPFVAAVPFFGSNSLEAIDPKSGKATRIGRKVNADGKLVRYAKKSGEEIK